MSSADTGVPPTPARKSSRFGVQASRIHITTRTISHYETLLRLPTETGVLRPESFLPAAFRFGLMADIDRWVLKRVVQSLAELSPSMPDLRLSTNLSGFAFEDEGRVVWFEGNYADYEADRHRRLGAEAERPHRLRYKRIG